MNLRAEADPTPLREAATESLKETAVAAGITVDIEHQEAFRPGRHFQDTRVARLYEGTDEILTLKIAAAILGKDYEAFQ